MSDKGEKYDDKGTRGSYCTGKTQFPNPEGMKTFPGFGADEADLELGFIRPRATQDPVFDHINSVDRWSENAVPDEDTDGGEELSQNIRFKQQDRKSKGMFARPRIPTER